MRDPKIVLHFQRAGLAPVIAEKLKAEKASIERMVKDAEAQLASKPMRCTVPNSVFRKYCITKFLDGFPQRQCNNENFLV